MHTKVFVSFVQYDAILDTCVVQFIGCRFDCRNAASILFFFSLIVRLWFFDCEAQSTKTLHFTNNVVYRWGSADAVYRSCMLLTEVMSSCKRHQSLTLVESPIVNICAAPLTNTVLITEPPPPPPLPAYLQKCQHSWGWLSPEWVAHCVCMRGLISRRVQTVAQRASRLLMPLSCCSSIRISKAQTAVDATQHKQADVAANTQNTSRVAGQLSQSAPRQGSYYGYFQISQIDFDGLLQYTSLLQ